MTDYNKTHGRCRECERRTGMPTVYAWPSGRHRRLRDAMCPRCPARVALRQTTLALMKTVQVINAEPAWRAE